MTAVLMDFVPELVAFNGICWKAYTRQLMPVAATSKRLAVLALYKEFQRDIPHYGGDEAGWIEFAIKTFETMPPRHNGTSIPACANRRNRSGLGRISERD